MLYKTRGIVLKTTGYKSSSVITQVFTEKFGLQSYLINGVRKSGSKVPYNVLQPLHLLEMVVYYKNSASLQRVKELRNSPVFFHIPLDVTKSTVCLFLCEVLYKTLRRQSGEDPALFEYIASSLELLDHHEGSIGNFHLLFLMGLTRHLGFYPDARDPDGNYFDLQNGRFLEKAPSHPWYIGPGLTGCWRKLIHARYEELSELRIGSGDRRQLLRTLLDYYNLHIEGFGSVRSYEVLQELFS